MFGGIANAEEPRTPLLDGGAYVLAGFWLLKRGEIHNIPPSIFDFQNFADLVDEFGKVFGFKRLWHC